ncbi:hypothetical protein AMTR_s00060p00039950, partial [Amborella trichopoda]
MFLCTPTRSLLPYLTTTPSHFQPPFILASSPSRLALFHRTLTCSPSEYHPPMLASSSEIVFHYLSPQPSGPYPLCSIRLHPVLVDPLSPSSPILEPLASPNTPILEPLASPNTPVSVPSNPSAPE